jgi:hypothetical protein
MPAYGGNPGPAEEDNFSDAPDSAEKGGEKSEEGESDSPTATIPKALLAGKDFKPGDEVVLQIVSLGEDEAVVKYAPEKPHDESKETEETPAHNEPAGEGAGGGDSGMGSMMY